jgi:O-antigen/teichoic acid export membrane protein
MAVASLGALLVSCFVPEALAVLVPPAYAPAARPALWLAFAAVALGAYTVASLGIGLALRTPLLAWCSGSGALVGLVLQWAWTPRFGPLGAAAATCAAYATAAIVTYRIAQAVHPLPLRGGRATMLVVVALGLALLVQEFAPGGGVGVGVKLAVASAFAAGCWTLRVHRDAGAIAPATSSVTIAKA